MRNVTDDNILAVINSHPEGVIVDVWATWCGPCQVMLPLVEQIETEYPNLTFLKAEVDQNRQFITDHRLRSVPSLVFFKDGECVNIHAGSLTLEQIRHKVREVLR